jgi:hypothetical protein
MAIEGTNYDNVEDIPELLMTNYLMRAAARSEFGGTHLEWATGDKTLYTAAPQAVKHFATGGAAEGEEFSRMAARQEIEPAHGKQQDDAKANCDLAEQCHATSDRATDPLRQPANW